MALSIPIIIISLLCIIQSGLSIGDVREFQGQIFCRDKLCQNKTLRCDNNPNNRNKDCTVYCDDATSCNNVVIERKYTAQGEMTVFCNAPNSCVNAIINDATHVRARGKYSLQNAQIYCTKYELKPCRIHCEASQSCYNMDLFCPPNYYNPFPNARFCQVYGNINGRDHNDNLNIHTLWGVQEIYFQNYKGAIKLYCNLGLAECDIEFTGANPSCKNRTSPCQDHSLNDGYIIITRRNSDGIIINGHQICRGIECRNKALICAFTSCTVTCKDEYSCHNSRIARSIAQSMFVNCNAQNSCSNSIIYGATKVVGSDEYALSNAEIYGTRDKVCKIECNAKLSCNEATFNGKLSSELQILCNSNEDTCNNINVYCPISNGFGDNPLCSIGGRSNDKHNTLNLYFNRGWLGWNGRNSINIGNEYKQNTQIIGFENMMHIYGSTTHKSDSCIISHIYPSNICVTDSPTQYPTQMPTEITSIPTVSPTQMPTFPTNIPTAIPTQMPTVSPTIMPTIPTNNPTAIPTQMPTLPTNNPTIIPTQSPTNHGSANYITVTIIMGCIIAVIIV